MSADDIRRRRQRPQRGAQAGAFVIELALVILAFFTFMFCAIEVARVMYMWNTLQEVTRRAASAAASTSFSDVTAMNTLRQQAVFRSSPGTLVAGDPVTDAHVRIDYMALPRAADGTMTLSAIAPADLPTSPTRNHIACMANPNATNCIRFVRVRICAPGADPSVCDSIEYVPMLPLISFSSLRLPPSTTIMMAESLGYESGQALGP